MAGRHVGLGVNFFSGNSTRMNSTRVLDRLDSLIDDLLSESDLPASSLASMLMAARDSAMEGYPVGLARRAWTPRTRFATIIPRSRPPHARFTDPRAQAWASRQGLLRAE